MPQPILPQLARPATVQPQAGNAFALPTNFTLKPRGSGQPLPELIQKKMESFFNTSFADVRIHVGHEAPSIGALAFTHGTDLYFAPGQYNPQSTHGQQLLGHELTHVVQQRAGRVRNPLGAAVAVVQDPALEAEAERMGLRAASVALTVQAKPAGAVPGVACSPAVGSRPSSLTPNGAILPAGSVARVSLQRKPGPILPAQALDPGKAVPDRSSPQVTNRCVQRAIVAIDGDTDTAHHKRATRNCLWNLQHKKKGQLYQSSDARGEVAGPETLGNLPADLSGLINNKDESIYLLAHGSRYSASIAGMDPKSLARWIRSHFCNATFTGTIKLVSCHSGADRSHQSPKDVKSHVYDFPRSYAEELARELAPGSQDTFQPSSVLGIVGVGWVDEISGSITAINKEAYDAALKKMSTNSDVGSASGSGNQPNPFTELSDPDARGKAIHAEFGQPVQVNVHKQGYQDDTNNPQPLHIGKGKWGKRAFGVGGNIY